MLERLGRLCRILLAPVPTPGDRTEQAVRVIQRHLDEASRRRGGEVVEARDLDPAERAALASDLAAIFKSGERIPSGLDHGRGPASDAPGPPAP